MDEVEDCFANFQILGPKVSGIPQNVKKLKSLPPIIEYRILFTCLIWVTYA
jgi:hypothetical protein